ALWQCMWRDIMQTTKPGRSYSMGKRSGISHPGQDMTILVWQVVYFIHAVLALVRKVKIAFYFSSRRRHTRCLSDWSSDVCSSDLSDPCGPSQKIECVFTASPETIRREPREFDLRRSVGNRRTWQSARCVILLFFRRGGRRFLGRYAPRICERYEIALPPINGEQISHHLPSHRQRRSIGISFLLFSFIDQGQIMILSGCQLRGFHQHTLDMFVALFGK